jgi:hypothetical protein
VVLPLVVGAAAVLILVLVILLDAGSDDAGTAAVEPRVVAAERRAFTATVPLAATVDAVPSPPGDPGTYMVTARVDPLVLYRLPEPIFLAMVKIPGGPPEFSCAAPGLASIPAATSASDQRGDSSGDPSLEEESIDQPAPQAPGRQVQAATETVVRCLVPAGVRVFPGLRGELSVITAQLPEAIVVPAGAVEPESAATGHVTVIGPDDEEERRPVQVGPSDGSFVVITAGLAEGEKVLDRVPIQAPATGADSGGRVLVR